MVYAELVEAAKGLSEYRQSEVIDFINYLKAKDRGDFKSAFDTLRKDAEGLPEMTLEEINAEISAARDESRTKDKWYML